MGAEKEGRLHRWSATQKGLAGGRLCLEEGGRCKDLQLVYLLAWLEGSQVPREFLLELGLGQSSECRRKFGGRAAMSPPAYLACLPFELFYFCVCQHKELLSSFRHLCIKHCASAGV